MMTKKNEKSSRLLAMLRYQAEHYQSLGKGAISQQLNARIRRLLNEMSVDAVNN
ncbi:MAG: hypothetical protein LBQ78_00400 [Tannerellaceae bacterium]|jgi:hypothetical protein|nr:hypothetical protein [Tannerellaceae bacterium]